LEKDKAHDESKDVVTGGFAETAKGDVMASSQRVSGGGINNACSQNVRL
jgi:hypothetical protein